LRDDLHQVLFDFGGVSVCGEVEALGEAGDVGVDDDADVLVEGISEDDVGGFSTDAAEGGELLHGVRNLAVVFLDDVGGGAADGGGFGAEEAGGLDDFFDVGLGGFGERFGSGIFFEEDGGDDVNADVSALGGEDGGDEEFIGVAVVESAFGVRIELLEFGEDLGGACFFVLERFFWHWRSVIDGWWSDFDGCGFGLRERFFCKAAPGAQEDHAEEDVDFGAGEEFGVVVELLELIVFRPGFGGSNVL